MLWLKKKKYPPSLATALMLIAEANEIVMQHKRNMSFMPKEPDFMLLCRIEEYFHHGHCMAGYVERCLRQRVAGEPEGAAKWHKAFDYHYPG